ncbi:MAG: metallopeptidase family protein [Alphaproteobacteria bacterium]
MNYSVPPSIDDVVTLAETILESLPDEILRHCEEVEISVEDFVEESIMSDLDIDDPFELLAFYKNGKEIAPGVQKKITNEEDVLVLYRRSILDMWCESEDDLESVIRQVMIEEIGRVFDLSDDDIRQMTDNS